MNLVFHRSDLQPLDVSGGIDRALGVGQVAESVFYPGQSVDSLWSQKAKDVLPDLSVQHTIDVFFILKKKWKVKKHEPLLEPAHGASRADVDIDRTELEPLDNVALACPELVVREDVNPDVPVCPAFDEFL